METIYGISCNFLKPSINFNNINKNAFGISLPNASVINKLITSTKLDYKQVYKKFMIWLKEMFIS